MDRNEAIRRIEAIFSAYKKLQAKDSTLLTALDKGKLYELYVLSQLLLDLRSRGFRLAFVGHSIDFKAAPGKIKTSDSHFKMGSPYGRPSRIFVDIEFETMGMNLSTTPGLTDRSARHELDLAVVDTNRSYPLFSEVLLAVECKSAAMFEKRVIREALGIRRELSMFTGAARPSTLTRASGQRSVDVPAEPASEFWLAYAAPKGDQYRISPSQFGVELKHIPLP